jgi:glycosyltransferase involved in cell wall biosynthesis
LKKKSGQPELCRVSVVIPTRDRAFLLRESLENLRKQDYPGDLYEIIVVDDGSNDETPAVATQFARSGLPEVRYFRLARLGLNAARNTGINAAKGELICFVDDDIAAPPTWLRAMVNGALRHPEAGCFGGPIRLRLEGKPPRMCGREPLGETELDCGTEERAVNAVFGANFALRPRAFERIGPFNEALPIYGEEEEWEGRYQAAGGVIWYIPEAWLWHRRLAQDLQFTRMLRRRFRRGVNLVEVLRFTGKETSVLKAFIVTLRCVGHCARRRCLLGIVMAAGNLGYVWGALRYKLVENGPLRTST